MKFETLKKNYTKSILIGLTIFIVIISVIILNTSRASI